MATASENVKIVETIYAKGLIRQTEAVRHYFTPRTEIIEADSLPYGGTYRGYDGYVNLLVRFSEWWTDVSMDIRGVFANGDDVMALLTVRGKVKGTPIEIKVAEAWEMKDGKVGKLDIYYFDTKKVADAAAGK